MSSSHDRYQATDTMAQINITPLIDVLLAVLVIFMIAAPLLTGRIVLPIQNGGEHREVSPLVLGVSIRDSGELVFQGHSSSRAALDEGLRRAATGGQPIQLEIRPEAHASYEDLANVLAIAQNNGISSLRVMAVARE
jgi:biopolymer transport protein ExbD/biopolymer transport protein TolR